MNRDEILAMPAGREMDALIAEKVVSWKVDDLTAYSPSGSANSRMAHGDDGWLEYYSTDISAAWGVVEKFNNQCMLNNVHGLWECYFPNNVMGKAETAPLAICRAALLAVSNE